MTRESPTPCVDERSITAETGTEDVGHVVCVHNEWLHATPTSPSDLPHSPHKHSPIVSSRGQELVSMRGEVQRVDTAMVAD